MKKFSWILSCAVLAVCLLLILPTEAHAAEIVDSGTCGENLTWTLDDAGTLTISGTGTMTNYSYYEVPWYSSYDAILAVVIEDGVTSIGDCAFYYCVSLTNVTVSGSVTKIGYFAFQGCYNMASITLLGDAPKTIFSHAFDNCTGLSDVYISDIAAWCNTSFPSSAANPLNYAENLYVNNQLVTELVIPNGVTSIGRYAFCGYSSLTSVAVADSVTSVGNSAFGGCSGLTSITIPDSVTSIGGSAFYNCTGLITVNFNATNCTTMGSQSSPVFSGCTNLTTINIGEDVTAIPSYAFSDCFSLKSITIPDSVISIGVSAFSGCSGLESMTIPFVGECRKSNTDTYQYPLGYFFGTASYTGGVATTQYYYGSSKYSTTSDTYYVPTALKTVTVTGGDIPYGAFYNCTNLTSVTIGDSVTNIGGSAFYGCSSLESMTVPFIGERRKTYLNTYQYPLGYFFGTASYTGGVATTQHYYGTYSSSFTDSSTYYIPASLKNVTVSGGNILYGAFYGCKNLTSITIEDGVTSIRESAFYNCKNLKTIRISAGITTLSSSTFSGCSNVEFMVLPESLAQINSEKDFFDIFTNEDFLLGVAPGSYAETLAIQYSKSYKYVFDGFSFAKEPTKKIYFTDEDLSLDGMVVLHGDGIGEAKEITDYSVTGYDSELGKKTITVSYQGYSIAFTVVVVDKNDFISGRGYEEDPVLIYDVEDLLAIEAVNQKYGYPFYYRLANNITLPDNWKPICDDTSPFIGTLDGNGFTITNLATDSVAPARKIGLFHTNNGVIKNLTVAEVSINATYLAGNYSTGDVSVGCIAVNNNGTINNCSVAGAINVRIDDKSSYGSTSNAYIGGIAAYNSGTITGCRNEVNIVAKSEPGVRSSPFDKIYATIYAGGIVGNSSGGTLIYNENCGDISVTTSMGTSSTTDTVYELNAYAGGIAAYSYRSIQQSRNFGNVSSGLGMTGVAQSRINTAVYAGGIVGDGGPCTNCYNTGNISSNGHTFVVYRESVNGSWKSYALGECYFGGIAGNGSASTCYSIGRVIECGPTDNSNYIQAGTFKSGSICGNGSTSACYSGTDDSMKQQSTYVGFDFDTIWRMPTAGAYMYPTLQCFADKLDSIFVSTLPEKLTYLDSQETLDLTGGMLTLVYDDGRTQTIQITTDMVLGFDNKIIGKQSVYIQYLGRTTSFEVEVITPTIIFVDYDGTIISSRTYRYGEAITPPDAPTRSSDNTYTYTFAGWDTEVTICQGNATYTATYTSTYINYTVVFKDWNGKILSTKTYHWSDKVTAPVDPTKVADNTYTYAFAGWDKAVVNCAGDATYTATYTSNYINYTVVFKNWNGTVLSSKTYHYGDTVTAPTNPTKTADNTYTYTFAGWDKAVTNCAGNATYTATYTSTYINYTVVFKDWNGRILSTKTYHWSDKVTAPVDPTKVADNTYTYAFAGWDKAVVNCAGDATYTATYTFAYINYTIVFKNWDGSVLDSDKYHYNDTVMPPANPTRPEDSTYRYTFKGWDSEIVNAIANKIYTAVYEAIKKIVEITSHVFNVQRDSIGKIGTGTSADSFVSKLDQGENVEIYKGSTQVSGSTSVGTGMEAKLMDGNEAVKTYTIVVTGDTNGDGTISVTDMISIKAHLLGKSKLTGAYAEAGDTSGDDAISITDFIQLKAQILGKGSIIPN